MLRKSALTISAAALALGVLAFGTDAQAQAGVKVGTLTCNVDSGWGFVFGSSRGLRCIYSPVQGVAEHYTGNVKKNGVDIGYQQGGVIVWGVIAPTSSLAPGALSGDYGGVTASATVAVGVGANVLVGGFNKSVTLQPVSIEGNLTVKGVTKPVTLTITSFKHAPNMQKKDAIGADASAKIKRSDFNMGKAVPLVGDELTLEIVIEAAAP